MLFIACVTGCETLNDQHASTADSTHTSFVHPPLPNVQVPFVEYTVDATRGDTLVSPSGGLLLFPPNAFIDAAGKIITGAIHIKYREFTKPLDFYLSGIPMHYDSAAQTFQFISGGMFEMLAFSNHQPVVVNPAAKPEVMLPAISKNSQYNAYYLDTVKQNWIYQGSATLVDVSVSHSTTTTTAAATITNINPLLLLPPAKASGKNPVISVKIDPSSFKELQVYNNQKFQLADGESFHAQDAAEAWTYVQVKEKSNNGLYTIQFSNAHKTVTYQAKPVLEGADYEAAMAVFKQKQQEQEQLKQERLQQLAQQKAKLIQDSIEHSRLIAEDYKRIEKLIRESEEKIRLAQEKKLKTAQLKKPVAPAVLSPLASAYIHMPVPSLGICNFDARYNYSPLKIELDADFVDTAGKPLPLQSVEVLTVTPIGTIPAQQDTKLVIEPGYDYVIIGSFQEQLFYTSATDTQKLQLTSKTYKQTFIMKQQVIKPANETLTNQYPEIEKVLYQKLGL
ncbi:high-affnity carbon uptake protein Hat/HatR [Filimonas lacunae]|nr:high-affnity carbon uptake protein Hat/HatR [Filimonas lacunae]